MRTRLQLQQGPEELLPGNAHSHARFDRQADTRSHDVDTPARDFGAYSVAFDDKALTVGEAIDAAPGVKLHRRC